MITDLEKRLQALRARQSETRAEGQSELDRWHSDLAAATAAMREEMAEATAGFEAQLKDAEDAVAPLLAAQQALSDAITTEAQRVKQLRRLIAALALGVCVVGAVILAVALWLSAETVAAAESEAARIRTENAAAIASAREDGEAALAALTAELENREAALSTNLTTMGAELAQIATERDTYRADLERFADLRAQIGFDLIPHRDRAVIVLPEGQTLTTWRAPGLSNLARFNGQMWRVVDEN